jgi:hypothetical protein
MLNPAYRQAGAKTLRRRDTLRIPDKPKRFGRRAAKYRKNSSRSLAPSRLGG